MPSLLFTNPGTNTDARTNLNLNSSNAFPTVVDDDDSISEGEEENIAKIVVDRGSNVSSSTNGASGSTTTRLSPTPELYQDNIQQQSEEKKRRLSSGPSSNSLKNTKTFEWELFSLPILPGNGKVATKDSSTFVKNATIYDVSSRITNVLRSRSIEAKYDPRNANGLLCGEIGNEFLLRLYRREEEDDDSDDCCIDEDENMTIVVTIQRKFGTSFFTFRDDKIYHEDRDAILRAVQGQ
jgi:hypothetical protein